MANDYNASVVISTAESERGIRSLDTAAKDLDKTLQNLHKSLKAGQSDLDKVSASMTELTKANTALIRSDQDRAKATLLAAKADGVQIVNQGKRAKTANDVAIADAKVAKIRQQTVTAGQSGQATTARRDAEALARITNVNALAQQKLTTEVNRTAAAQANATAATARAGQAAGNAAAQAQRLANGQRSAQSGTLALNDSLSNSRYLLYDVGQTYTVLALALQAIPIATAAVAIAYEKDFAQVIRTNDTLAQGGGFDALREDLKQLATEIPLTFAQFSEISTIGGQLGIAGDDVSAFTESVARFGAASNVSIDQAATAFGRFQNSFDPQKLDPNFFNKIGSAVAYVGVKSAATETEIIAVSNQISAAGAQFGFAADEVVGLSGALASVRIRPELARGAFQRIMLGLSRSADEGAESFQKFGKYTGLAAEESMALFKTDPSAFFYKYIGGIKNSIKETGSVSAVLDDIGAKNVFDKQFILGLANGYDVFGQSLANANGAFNEGTFLNTSTAGIFDTVDAKLKRITASIQNFADTIGKGSLQGLSGVADNILEIVNGLDRFAQATPGFTTFINLVLGLGSAIGILLAFKAAQAFMLAGLVGFQQVLGKGTLAAGLTAKGILQQVAVTMLMSKGVTQAHSQALVAQAGAFKVMGMSAATANAQVIGGAFANGTVVRNVGAATSTVGRFTGALGAAGRGAMGLVGGPIGVLLIALGSIALGFAAAEEKANSAGDAIARAMKNGADAGKTAIAESLTDRTVDSFITDVGSGGLDNHGKNIRQLAEEVGISFNDIVNSISKGKDASAEFGRVLDAYSQKKGFKDFADLQAKSLTNLSNRKGELQFLGEVVKELGDKSAESAKDVEAVDGSMSAAGQAAAAAGPEAAEFADEIGGVGDEAVSATQKLDDFIDKVFGIVDASGATQSALQSLGEGLANSSDFGPGTEGGRENVDAFRETLKAAAREQQMLIETTGKSTQQASADYIAFVNGLVAQMTARGVDPAGITMLANQAKGIFGSTLLAGPKPVMPVGVDPAQTYVAAATAKEAVQRTLAGFNSVDVLIGANTDPAAMQVQELARALSEITGIPYMTVVDALTNPAHEKAAELQRIILAITNDTYTAPIGADTSAAVTNVRNFAQYASSQLAAIQNAYNQVAASAPTLAKYTKSMFKGVTGVTNNASSNVALPAPQQSTASIPVQAAPTQVAPSATPNFGSLNDGYDKVRDAAKKAGDTGKQAGKDMADGIDEATRAADDYANRLKTGLTSAFDSQYGLQKATDDYHTALNAISKKREDEKKQLKDLLQTQKELNTARKEELVNARKAGIEKDISLKYGEVDRAADYAQQEEEALNAAAAKQKDIEANGAQIVSLQAGIGNLKGYSQAAIDNREALRGLEQKMLDMVGAYASTGVSVDQVRVYAQNLTGQFKNDVTQMGFNELAVGNLRGSLERYIDVIGKVPRTKPTEVTANVGTPTSGAMGAMNAFGKAGDWATRPRNQHVGLTISQEFEQFLAKKGKFATMADVNGDTFRPGSRAKGGIVGDGAYAKGGSIRGFAGGGLIPGKAPSDLSKDNLLASVDGKGLVEVQSEEFIMKKRAVDFWGTDTMNNMNNMKMPSFSGGGAVGGRSSGSGSSAPMLVELTAENLAAILRLANSPTVLYAGVEQLASTVNEGNRILATKGVS